MWAIKDENNGTFWSTETGASCALIFTDCPSKARLMSRRMARSMANKMDENIVAVEMEMTLREIGFPIG